MLLVRLSLTVLGGNDNLRSQYAMLAESMIDADAFESVFQTLKQDRDYVLMH